VSPVSVLDLRLDGLAADGIEIDFDLLPVLVPAVDFVAVALGDLELLDLEALDLQVVLKLRLVLPLRLVGGGAFRAGEGQRAREGELQQQIVRAHGDSPNCELKVCAA
jgi:hypothetical protein